MARASLLIILLCWQPGLVALAQAQQAPAAETSGEVSSERRVRRLGDVDSDEFELDLTMPEAPVAPPPQSSQYVLPDPQQNARLQQLLQTLAARPGDKEALDNLEVLLDQVIKDATALMGRRQFDQAGQLLGVVRNVDPRKAGLEKAMQDLSTYRDARYPYEPPSTSGQKLNTVESLSPLQLPDANQRQRLEQLLASLTARPGNSSALRELDELLDDVLLQASRAMEQGDFELAERLHASVRTVNPRKRGLVESRRRLEDFRQVSYWLELAEQAEGRGILIEPLIDSAYYYYRKALLVDANSLDARRGLLRIQQAMVVNALDAARAYDFELAEAWLKEAASVRDEQGPVEDARRQIAEFQGRQAQTIDQEVQDAIARGDFDYAQFKLIDLIALGGHEQRVAQLRALMSREQEYGRYEPGQLLQDRFREFAGSAPQVVVIAPGSFLMGSAESDDGHDDNEAPQRRVAVERAFAMGLREVTVAQFRDFIRQSAYRTEAERAGSSSVWDDTLGRLTEREGVNWQFDYAGRPAADNLPVVHVSWQDAQEYLRWLSRATGQRYRLPSEAEFEYALRAGTRSNYWWGEGRPRGTVENLAGADDRSESGRQFGNFMRGYGDGYWGPAPVASFEANAWGLFDMAGNVSEWVQDCWHPNYMRAPATAMAWENAGCERRVVRSGYWASRPEQARSAARTSAPASLKAPQLGFRVARDL
jgi:formylglycine-generating enzyme required for sulfatase activity